MKKMTIKAEDLREWMMNSYQEYASLTSLVDIERRRLKFKINYLGDFRVTLGDEVLYEGNKSRLAISAFEKWSVY